VNHELAKEIKHMLEQQCLARCLDDEEDFKAVMEVIDAAIKRWTDSRCDGCR